MKTKTLADFQICISVPLIDFVNIYIFSVGFVNIDLFSIFLSIDFAQWRIVGLPHIAYIAIH